MRPQEIASHQHQAVEVPAAALLEGVDAEPLLAALASGTGDPIMSSSQESCQEALECQAYTLLHHNPHMFSPYEARPFSGMNLPRRQQSCSNLYAHCCGCTPHASTIYPNRNLPAGGTVRHTEDQVMRKPLLG